MRILRTMQGIQTWRRRHDSLRDSIGFVPTMGALHDGHRSLMRQARRSCRTVVVSIFVNPLQFGPAEDYRRYRRTAFDDLAFCRQEDVDMIIMPAAATIYPHTFQTTVTVKALSQRWEGAHRPAHFQGVTTVMAKLFNLIRPTHVFLGKKDYQQCLVIRQLAQDMAWDLRVMCCPTIRDSDGFAISSRNHSLTAAQRQQALGLYRALLVGKHAIAGGARRASPVEKKMAARVNLKPPDGIDYLACCDARTLEPLAHLRGTVVLLGAIRVGAIRLIDNLIVQIRR